MRKETYLKVITLLLFTVSPLIAQENTIVHGTISAPLLGEASVHIINSTQGTGTVNSNSGSFQILVKENDELLFSSIQYKNITVKITSEIIEKGILDITLIEDLNELDAVNISNIKLTGNIATDIAGMEVVKDMPVNISFGAIKDIPFEADINDAQEGPRNRAFESNTIMKPGVNFLALPGAITALLGIKEKPKVRINRNSTKTSSEKLKELFENNFFTETLNIEEAYIDDFIFFAEDNGLSSKMGANTSKLVVIDFLMDQSKKYNLQLDKN